MRSSEKKWCWNEAIVLQWPITGSVLSQCFFTPFGTIFYHKNVCATLDVTDSGHVTRIPLSSVSGKFLLILRTVIAVPLQVDGLFLRLKTKLISEKHIWGRSNFQPWSFAAKMDTTSEKQEGISCISWFKARQKSRRVARVASKLRMEVVQHSGLMWRRTSFDLKLRFCNFANHWPMGKFSLQWLTWPSFHIQQRSEVWTEGQRYEQKSTKLSGTAEHNQGLTRCRAQPI